MSLLAILRRPHPNCGMHRRTAIASLPVTFVRTAISRTPVVTRALTGLDQHVIQAHASTVLAASLLLNSLAAPLECSAAVAVPTQIAAEAVGGSPEPVVDAPDVHAGANDTQPEQQWWQEDGGAWLELTTPAELSAFLNCSQAAPAWPYLEDVQLAPKLRIVEFYATWCPACRAVAAGMAAVAQDPQLQPTCIFARANADRVKPLMKQLGISKIPTALIISPEGHVLDSVRASGQVVREAVLQHAAALSKATDGRILPPPAAAAAPAEIPLIPSPDELSPSEVDGLPLTEDPADITPAADASGVMGGLTLDAACRPQPAVHTNSSSSSSSGEYLQGVEASSTPVSIAAAGLSLEAEAAQSSAKQPSLQQYGSEYGYGGVLAQHYQQEVARRLAPGQHYVDHTGTSAIEHYTPTASIR